MKDYKTPIFEIVFLQQDVITNSVITNVVGENFDNDCYDDGWLD